MPLATVTTNRLLLYGAVSTALASLAVYTTFSTHSNFYSAVVHLSKSNGSILTLANFMVFLTLMVAKVMQLIFFGPLRANEVERLYDRTWYFLTESLLAFTIFREDFDAAFVCLFGGLLFVKSFHWILADRVEAMDQQPYPGPPKSFHIRTLALFNLLALVDVVVIGSLVEVILHDGVDGLVLFVSEYAILLASLLNSWLKYLISVYDIYRASRRGGDDAPPWEHKSMYIFYVELLTDFLKLSTYLAFFLTVLTYYGLPLNIIRDVFLTARSFIGRVRDLLRYRAATRDMDHRYPDALPAEMEALGDRTCIICREEMVSRGAAGAGAVTGGPNTTPKKLPCGHIFHFHCLRSWLERQQSCPTCRRTVLESGRPGAAANGNAANANPAAPNPAAGAVPNPQGAVELFNRVWNAPGQGAQPPAGPAPAPANGQPPAAPPPPFAQLPPFPWHGGQINQPQWPPQVPRQFQGFNAGGQWHPWGAPPGENERAQRAREDSTPNRTVPPAAGSGVTTPGTLDRDATTPVQHNSSNPPPPAPTPVRQVITVPNKTPPEAKEGAKSSESSDTAGGSGLGTTAREAAALAALRRFQAGRSTESLKSSGLAGSKPGSLSSVNTTEPKSTPRTLPSSPSGSIGPSSRLQNGVQETTEAADRAEKSPTSSVQGTRAHASGPSGTTFSRTHAPNLIPLYNPGLNSPGLGSNIPSPYFLPPGASSTPLIDIRQSPAPRPTPYLFGPPSNGPRAPPLPRHGQIPSDVSDTQLRQLDQVTREAIDERLRVLESVQTTVWQCVEELTRLRSSLPDPGLEERRGSTSGPGGNRGATGSVNGSTSSFEADAFAPPNIQVDSTELSSDMDVKGKGKASVEAKAEADEAPVVDTDVIDTR
ncbi:E3 ubiquitin-protein ligase synoviolin [Rhizoctonia solani AG-1 IB]|uniref:RING-type E3 ubiquitin transferase n=1 Tax=Thanatephorus cucumeris (strain AG1-IB / isolate 7/3/14) TaxID=1108050 RepID=A0A0B7F7Y4_THACB|nr:E3 ubiquitin-protein ligase synoviolin [Rhizoctonia solani AG-1 IB]